MKSHFIPLLALFVASCSTFKAPPDQSVFLGEKNIAFGNGYESVQMDSREKSIHSLIFIVRNEGFNLHNFVVIYTDGSTENLAVTFVYTDDEIVKRIVPISANGRGIAAIGFNFRSRGSVLGSWALIQVRGI